MMQDGEKREFTITELEQTVRLNRRTIHFYVKERVVPPPVGAGGAARYNEEHLLRLLLIRELQKSHLKLSGVREALDRMTVGEMRERVRQVAPSSPAGDKEAFQNWIEGNLQRRLMSPIADMDSSPPPTAPWNRSFLDIARGKGQETSERDTVYSSPAVAPQRRLPTKGGTWERIEVAEGIEVLVRSDLTSKYMQVIEELADRIRKKS